MIKRANRVVLVAAMGLLLSGCGFHLRGSIALPESVKNMYVFGASSDLHNEVKGLLKSANGKLAASPNEAGVVVKVLKEDVRRRILSVGSTGKSSEMELDYYLRFQLYDKQEKPLMDEQTIELSREFFNDQLAVLAKDSEELMIRKEIYKQAARMLMSRAQIAVENQSR